MSFLMSDPFCTSILLLFWVSLFLFHPGQLQCLFVFSLQNLYLISSHNLCLFFCCSTTFFIEQTSSFFCPGILSIFIIAFPSLHSFPLTLFHFTGSVPLVKPFFPISIHFLYDPLFKAIIRDAQSL